MGLTRAHLARVTAEIHQALHDAEPFARIAEGRVDLAGYGALLAILYRYHGAMAGFCEAGALALNLPGLALAHLGRVARLEDDLAFLGAEPVPVAREALCDEGFAVGCLYTVLGATLGGKVISRQLEQLLPDGQGRSFFAGTAEDGAHWRSFCARLEESGHALSVVEAGARHAFARFARLIEDWRDLGLKPGPHAPGDAAGQRIL